VVTGVISGIRCGARGGRGRGTPAQAVGTPAQALGRTDATVP
jgi:hypothetical protein